MVTGGSTATWNQINPMSNEGEMNMRQNNVKNIEEYIYFNVILKLNGTHGYVYSMNWAVNMSLYLLYYMVPV